MKNHLNIIGCGKVASTLACLWHAQGTLEVRGILNRSTASSAAAAAFIGTGHVARSLADLPPADVVLLGVGDDHIAQCCLDAVAAGAIARDSVVFHCSGALPSSILHAARDAGAHIASVHPIRSFANPAEVARTFNGTYCGIEGDPIALAVLGELFEAIGAQLVPIHTESKTLYHAAAVFASNYLVTLLDTAVKSYGAAGIDAQTALKLMVPLVRESVDNVFLLGPANALTGPIARGDTGTVLRQYRAVKKWDRRYGALYKQMGRLTNALRRSKTSERNG